MRTPIRIIVVDDYEPWRRFLRLALLPYPELQVIGEFADGPEAIQKAKELLPDLILLDIGLPTLNGIEAARCIQKVSPDSKILFVSEERLSSVAEEAMRTGASGYVVKSDAAIELLLAIKSILEGKQFFSLRISSSGPSRH